MYTYVPLEEMIEMTTKKLLQIYNKCPVEINTFIEFTKLNCSKILIEAHKCFQDNGLAMVNQFAHQLADICLALMEKKIYVGIYYHYPIAISSTKRHALNTTYVSS